MQLSGLHPGVPNRVKPQLFTHQPTMLRANRTPADQWIRFGCGPSSDSEADALLTALTQRLNEARDWELLTHKDKYGSLSVGTDVRFRIDDTTYTLRDIYGSNEDSYPDNLTKGTCLLAQGPDGEKTYPMDYDTTYLKFWPVLMEVANPIMSAKAVSSILKNADKLSQPYLSTSTNAAVLIFNAGDRNYRLDQRADKQKYLLYEEQMVPEETIRQYWENLKAFYQEHNQPAIDKIKTYEAFRQSFRNSNTSRILNKYPISQEQYETVFNAIKGTINAYLTERYGIGPNFNPRPILTTMARELLKAPNNNKVGYRYTNHEEQVTFHPTRGEQPYEPDTDLLIEVCKEEYGDQTGYFYEINAREGNPTKMHLMVTDPGDIALIEKMLEIVKATDTTYGGNWHIALAKEARKIFGEAPPASEPADPKPDPETVIRLMNELEEMLPAVEE